MLTLGFQKCHFCVLKVPLLAPKSGTFARQKLNFCNAISKRMNMQSENMAFFDSIKSPRNGLFASFTPGNLIFFISTYPFPILFLYICKTYKIKGVTFWRIAYPPHPGFPFK